MPETTGERTLFRNTHLSGDFSQTSYTICKVGEHNTAILLGLWHRANFQSDLCDDPQCALWPHDEVVQVRTGRDTWHQAILLDHTAGGDSLYMYNLEWSIIVSRRDITAHIWYKSRIYKDFITHRFMQPSTYDPVILTNTLITQLQMDHSNN